MSQQNPEDLGLPPDKPRSKGGSLTIRLSAEDWAALIRIRACLNCDRLEPLSITDTVRFALRYADQNWLGE